MQKICPFSYYVFCRFQWAEIPALWPEIPAPGSSGPSTGISGPYFHLSFLAKSFWLFSLEGVRNFAPEVSSEISGGPEILARGPEVPVQGKFG